VYFTVAQTQFKEINRVLFGEEEGQQQDDEESQQKGVIVKLSKEQIRELSKHAKSSSKKTISSKDKPFNLRSGSPIYSNTLGRFYEITPEKNPQLRDMDVFVSFVDMKEVTGPLISIHLFFFFCLESTFETLNNDFSSHKFRELFFYHTTIQRLWSCWWLMKEKQTLSLLE